MMFGDDGFRQDFNNFLYARRASQNRLVNPPLASINAMENSWNKVVAAFKAADFVPAMA